MSVEDRERWDARYAEGDHGSAEPSAVVVGLDAWLPRAGRALDVAGGAGRHALWLARRGLDVTLVDVSPVGLAIAAERARAAGLALATVARDLEREPLPEGAWDLVLSVLYLGRGAWADAPRVLAPGGVLAVVQPTLRNLERHERPPARVLLREGELASLLPEGLELVHHAEGWSADGRHDAVLVARKPLR